MKSFSSLHLFLLLSGLCFFAGVQAAQANSQYQSRSWISLGEQGKITAVKKRVRRSCRATRHRLNINRQITAKSVLIMDAETGKTLFAKNQDKPRQPASTIKIITGMIAIKSLQNDDLVRVSRHAAGMPRSKVYLDTKKVYRADDLINAMLLASANDASVALAEKIAGSEKDFATMMNLRAQLWGARATVCRTATGLTARGQHSTARDLATLFRHAMQDKEFARRMRRRKMLTSYGKMLRNHNKALWRVKGALGGKTGYTAAARQTYVGKFARDGNAIIVAIMGSETMWPDIKKLVEYGFEKKTELVQQQEKKQLARID